MLNKIIAFVESLIVHALFLMIIFFGVDLPKFLWFINHSEVPVENTLLDEDAVLMELERLKQEAYSSNATKQVERSTLKQQKNKYEQFISQEKDYLKDLHQQRKNEKQRLKELKRQRLKEEKKLKKLLRKKEKLEKNLG